MAGSDFDDLFAEFDSGTGGDTSAVPAVPAGGGKKSGGGKRSASRVKPTANNDGDDAGGRSTLWKTLVYGGIAVGSLLILIVAGVIVFSLMSGNSSGDAGQPKDGVSQGVAIKAHNSVLDDLDSIKDSQISALTEKLAKIEGAPKNSKEAGEGYKALVSYTGKQQAVIDTVLSKFYALSPSADDGAINVAREDIAKSMTPDAATTVSYDLMKGASPAKMLNAEGKLSGSSTVMVSSMSADATTYIVISPFTTDGGTTHAVSTVVVTNDGTPKVMFARFVGVLTDSKVGALEDSLKSAADSVKLSSTDNNNTGGEGKK